MIKSEIKLIIIHYKYKNINDLTNFRAITITISTVKHTCIIKSYIQFKDAKKKEGHKIVDYKSIEINWWWNTRTTY